MTQVFAYDKHSRSRHRPTWIATIALILGTWLLAGCAAVAPLTETPPPSPFTEHGQ